MTDKYTGVRGRVLLDEPMSVHTSWRAGGNAQVYFVPVDLADLQYFLSTYANDCPLLWLGLGSNLLVRDRGFPGIVIAYSKALQELEITDAGTVKAGAGVACAKIARLTARQGYSGAEFLAGIPGCIGGALAMNAGAFGSETWQIVSSVNTINRLGEISRQSCNDFNIEYRSVTGKAESWFTGAELKLEKDTSHQASAIIKSLLDKRAETQPLGIPSCGSVFRNPPNDHAARLIEACGLKGFRVGDACISEKHANFIINLGAASAADIEELISRARNSVLEKFNIELIPEAHIVGDS